MKGQLKLILLFFAIVFLFSGLLIYLKYFNGGDREISSSSLDEIKSSGKLVVGSDIPYGVMEFFDESGNPAGVDFDIASEIASNLGTELEFRDYSWTDLFPAVKSGEIDLAISSITITEERSKEMLLSIPYFSGGQVILVRADNSKIKLPSDLTNKKVGALEGTTGYDEAVKYVPTNSIVIYPGYDDESRGGIVFDLKNGVTDAVVVDYIVALGTTKEDSSLKLAGEPFTQEYYGIATELKNEDLMIEVNTILRDLKRTGKLDEIKNKWKNVA